MSPHPEHMNSLFDEFVQELPAGYEEMAYEFKAFSRGRKIKSPQHLLQVVMLYCGVDLSLRGTAGALTLLQEKLSDTAVHKRLKACGPWLKALCQNLYEKRADNLSEGKLRFLLVDGSTVQTPGAKGISYRLHLAIDMLNLEMVHTRVTDAHIGESLDHYPLQSGDVVLVDRGYNQPRSLIRVVKRGASVVLRYNPHGMNLYDEAMEKVDIHDWLKPHKTRQSRAVRIIDAKQKHYADMTLHAIPLPEHEAEKARERLRKQAKKRLHAVEKGSGSGWLGTTADECASYPA